MAKGKKSKAEEVAAPAGPEAPSARPKSPKGRKLFVPTEEQRAVVRVMVAGGIEQLVISDAIGISRVTLAKHFRKEIDIGAGQANAHVVANLFKQTKDNVRAAEFWLTNRDGKNWSHKREIAHDVKLETVLGDRVARAQARLKTKG
ncbi:MAG: hypothetical protein WCP82_10065 [Alphaproteobacteria bacterium]